jgi:hypothetical protein
MCLLVHTLIPQMEFGRIAQINHLLSTRIRPDMVLYRTDFYTQMVCYASDMYRNNLNGNNFLELKLGTMEQTINLFFKKKKCILKK